MRKIDALPAAVIEIAPHIRNVAARIAFGPGKAARWVLNESVPRRKDVGFEDGMAGWSQLLRRFGKFGWPFASGPQLRADIVE